MLLKPFGPLHVYVALPGDVVDAVRFKESPLHTGVLLAATGVAGGVGSVKVKGPAIFELHPFNVTRMLS